jgi:hypothetical protein
MATAVLCSRAPNAIPIALVSRTNTTKPASWGQFQPVAMSRPAARATVTVSSVTPSA